MVKEKYILLVEDSSNDEMLTLHALKSSRIVNRVEVVRDGAEALDYLFARGAYSGRNREDRPAVMLLDLKLPKLDGIEVLRRLRSDEETKLLPVVILTSSREEQDVMQGYQFGANSFVRKPVNFEQFSKAVSELGLYWLLFNEPPPPGKKS